MKTDNYSPEETEGVLKPFCTDVERPVRMTNPFAAVPHPLCVAAAGMLMETVRQREDWRDEVEQGKMFGVLVVERTDGSLGYLSAYSGQIGGRSDWKGFVPAVFDYLQPDGYFCREEAAISAINRQLEDKDLHSELVAERSRVDTLEIREKEWLQTFRSTMQSARQSRQERRGNGMLSQEEEAMLVRESQFMKAELRRMKKASTQRMEEARRRLDSLEERIAGLSAQRAGRSDALQRWLFDRFVMLNAKGERKSLTRIFMDATTHLPPGGAGECCAPKLLQYAFLHGLRPVGMAEFWWGASPKTEIRRHGFFYPACRGKCKPILDFMLQGLDVEPLRLPYAVQEAQVRVVYEDAFLAVVDKPCGVLSVPGKSGQKSVYDFMRRRWPDADGPLVVHRLDMDTSGLLVLARDKHTHQRLQAQFRRRAVKKVYVAVLVHRPDLSEGWVNLPLRPDPYDRPRQVVDSMHGKPSRTFFRVVGQAAAGVRVELIPYTGRTHQLRVHCAHTDGLNAPILGDCLYGQPAGRLYLHAARLSFVHPVDGRTMEFVSEVPF